MSKNNLKLIVFDLDYTLWPFYVDTHFEPPFRKGPDGNVVDRDGVRVKCFPEVPDVLKTLSDEGYVLGIASRTGELEGAEQLIRLFGWDKYFEHRQIYPGCKVTHLNNLRKSTNFKFSQMIFFDDEDRNIKDVSQIGVVSILVKNGVTKEVVKSGIEKFLNN